MVESVSYGHEGRVTVYPIANVPFYEDNGLVQTEEYNEKHDAFLWELPTEVAKETLRTLGVIS